jgi:hypothetical protein
MRTIKPIFSLPAPAQALITVDQITVAIAGNCIYRLNENSSEAKALGALARPSLRKSVARRKSGKVSAL